MRTAPAWLGLLLMAAALSGCLQGDPDDGGPGDGGPDGPTDPSGGDEDSAPGDGGQGPSDEEDAGPPSTGTPPDPDAPAWQWPALDEATIRPGVQMVADGSQCTSNFVFLPPDNATVYLGFAAHCVGTGGDASNTDGCDADGNAPLPLGTEVEVQGASRPATLAYTSWGTMQAGNETGGAVCGSNDFALVEIHPDDHAKVHPAMLTFGGPTGLAAAGEAAPFDKVLTFGNTGLRPGPAELDAKEGYVWDASSDWSTIIYTVTPGPPGDSGSGVLLGDGTALGVLVTVLVAPFPAANGATSLDLAMQYAAGPGDLPVRLATWDVLDEGRLP